MILLPVLMTIVPTVNFIAQNCVEWLDVLQTTDERFPGNILYIVFLHIIWNSNGVMYALMILFFNVTLRHECLKANCFKKTATENVKIEAMIKDEC